MQDAVISYKERDCRLDISGSEIPLDYYLQKKGEEMYVELRQDFAVSLVNLVNGTAV